MNARTSQRDTVLQMMADSVQAFLPLRIVQRTLLDPANMTSVEQDAGVLCIVAGGGGQFVNWQGREGELGTVRGTVVGFVSVGERESPLETERAELALLEDFLNWVGEVHPPEIGAVYPGDYKQSSQMEHPIGWFALQFELRNV